MHKKVKAQCAMRKGLGKLFLEEQNLKWTLKDQQDVMLWIYGGDGEEESVEQTEKDVEVRELGILSSSQFELVEIKEVQI